MSINASQGMADILLLDIAKQSTDQLLLLIAMVSVTLVVVIFILIKYRNKPVRRLRRQLTGQQLTARQAAHILAHQVNLDSTQAARLDEMRFAKTEPTPQQVISFMQQLRFL